MRVGFAGLGRMGLPMARNLAKAGFELTVWNRTGTIAHALSDQTGCAVAASPRAMAEKSDIVFTMLADDASSKEVHFGADGIFAAPDISYLIEMGTMSPDHIANLMNSAPSGVTVIDAPVSGATQAAEDAQLLFMAGCNEDHARSIKPYLDAMGRRTIALNKPGSGCIMKLAVNALIHGMNQTVAEALTLTEAAGISSELAFDIIEASAAAAPMLKYRRSIYLDEASHDVTFTVSLARKDMEITAALCKKLGVPFSQGIETLARLKDAESRGYGARDMAALLDYTRKEAP